MTEKIFITTDFITLSAFLKLAGAAETGGHAKDIIAVGKVLINGDVCLQKGKKLYGCEIVTAGGHSYEVSRCT